MRIRLTDTVKEHRILSLATLAGGGAPPTYPPGDYIVGEDIPEDLARDALLNGKGIRIHETGVHETKLA